MKNVYRNKYLAYSTCALMLSLGACGDSASDGTAITDVSSGFNAVVSALDDVVPENTGASVSSSSFSTFASLEDVWENATYAIDSDTNVKEKIEKYFADYSSSLDNYYSFRNRITGTLKIPCVAGYYVGNNGTLLNAGSFTPTFDWSSDISAIQAACSTPDDFFQDEMDGATPTIVVSDVSGESGSLYDQKMTIDFDGDASVDVVYYFKISQTSVKVSQIELNGGSGSKSSTYIDYNPSTGAISADYMTGADQAHAPVDEGIRLFSDGTNVDWFAYLNKSSGNYFIAHFSYLANSPTEMAVSVTTQKSGAGGGDDLSNASACVLLSDYSIRRDNSVACEVDGKPANNIDSFILNTLTQTSFSDFDTHSSSMGVPFSSLTGSTGMYQATQ